MLNFLFVFCCGRSCQEPDRAQFSGRSSVLDSCSDGKRAMEVLQHWRRRTDRLYVLGEPLTVLSKPAGSRVLAESDASSLQKRNAPGSLEQLQLRTFTPTILQPKLLMPIEFNCESCSKLLRVPDGSGGKQCQCPGCGELLTIPLVQSPAANVGAGASTNSDIALCIPCPKCKHELICDPSLVGTKGQCRSCKHIFVITDLPTQDVSFKASTINWLFSCPKCAQLFEGNEAIRGKRGKCHACGDVFTIELQVAEETAPQPSTEKSPSTGKTSSGNNSSGNNSFDSFEGELTLDAPIEVPIEETRALVRTATSPGTVVSKASANDKRPIQFNCSKCKGRMEVPGIAAKQLTHCPLCKRQQTIPSESEPTLDELAKNDPWADLGTIGEAPAAMPQANPFGDTLYPPPSTMLPLSMSSMTNGRRRSGDNSGQFMLAGIFVSLCALIAIGLELTYIGFGSFVLAAGKGLPPTQQNVITVQIFFAFCGLVLSVLQIIGGIALARRRALGLARTAAIICCLPCLCVLNMPFGVWGCILTFGENAKREFR